MAGFLTMLHSLFSKAWLIGFSLVLASAMLPGLFNFATAAGRVSFQTWLVHYLIIPGVAATVLTGIVLMVIRHWSLFSPRMMLLKWAVLALWLIYYTLQLHPALLAAGGRELEAGAWLIIAGIVNLALLLAVILLSSFLLKSAISKSVE